MRGIWVTSFLIYERVIAGSMSRGDRAGLGELEREASQEGFDLWEGWDLDGDIILSALDMSLAVKLLSSRAWFLEEDPLRPHMEFEFRQRDGEDGPGGIIVYDGWSGYVHLAKLAASSLEEAGAPPWVVAHLLMRMPWAEAAARAAGEEVERIPESLAPPLGELEYPWHIPLDKTLEKIPGDSVTSVLRSRRRSADWEAAHLRFCSYPNCGRPFLGRGGFHYERAWCEDHRREGLKLAWARASQNYRDKKVKKLDREAVRQAEREAMRGEARENQLKDQFLADVGRTRFLSLATEGVTPDLARCPDCWGELRWDGGRGEVYCLGCGLVVADSEAP